MWKCKLIVITVILCKSTLKINAFDNLQYREKRTLIYPEGGSRLLAICGFGIPVDLKTETVIVGVVFKANYDFPTNASEITNPLVTYAKKRRSLNRWEMYSLFSQAMEMRGFGGKACLLKTICEVAKTPLVKNLGIFHELIHTFFTPTSTNEKIDSHADNEYYAAQSFGQRKKDCKRIFKDCSYSFLDMFTTNGNALL